MFVKPDNWSKLSPLERRKLRLDHWQNQPVEFVSPEAEANYKERINRIRKAYDIEPADRIIADLSMGAGEYALRRKGVTGKDMLYHPEKLHDPIIEFNLEFQLDSAVSAFSYPGDAMDLLGLNTYIWGGQKLPDAQTILMSIKNLLRTPPVFSCENTSRGCSLNWVVFRCCRTSRRSTKASML